MASSGNTLAPARAKQLKVLMPASLNRLRISDELAGCFYAVGGGGGVDEAYEATALVLSPFGKVWRVEVGRDGDGAFLGRGWEEFLAAHGIGVGWFVVLRHQGGAALTVKAFDTSFCIKEFSAPAAVMASSRGSKEVSCKPQFIRLVHQTTMEKMIVPAKFLRDHVSKEYMNTRMAVLFSPLGKFWRIELEKNDGSGVFFAGGWSEFLAFHGISEGDVLLFRYEGNMVFRFKVFGINGRLKDLRKSQNTGIQQMTTDHVNEPKSSSPIIRKRKRNDDSRSSSEENSRMKSCMKSSNKTSALQNQPDYQIVPPYWIKKKITTYMLEHLLPLSVIFCNSIGFWKSCIITLKTATNSTRSWQVQFRAYSKICYLLGDGWKRFCQDTKLKKGDLCTIHVIKPTLWHVVISDYTQEPKEPSPCFSSSRECDNRQRYTTDVLSRDLSYNKSVYEIGPPSWIQKRITPNSLKKHLSLARAFCYEIGLRESSIITLKTSIKDTRSWQVCGSKLNESSYHLQSGWMRFCKDNRLKIGDVCTFNIVETSLWHVDITRQ